MKRVAVVGTQGVPARYGGFETLAENLVSMNGDRYVYTVFCSSKSYPVKESTYKGAALHYIPLNANGVQSILYDMVSLFYAARKHDVILMLGVSGCLALPYFRWLYPDKKLIVNIDGLEHRRGKWNGFAKWFLRVSEALAIRYATEIVVDNQGIQDYVTTHYARSSVLIAYGGDHTLRNLKEECESEVLKEYRLKREDYSLSVCRIEPENNCHLILETYSGLPNEFLVFIGNWGISKYSRKLKYQYGNLPNILLVESLYDLDKLFVLRKNCKFYLHGHSAGGTNPSLVEAMHTGSPVLAFDCIYNKESTDNQAFYFKTGEDLKKLIAEKLKHRESLGGRMKTIARKRYQWVDIVKQYEALYG